MEVLILPVDEETFFNILGEEVSRTNIVQETINYYQQKLAIGETAITDFNEGSEIRNLIEAIAVDLYVLREEEYESSRVAFISTSYGAWLDLHGENPLIGLPREQGSEAIGLVTFSIPEALTSEIIIPEETILIDENNGLEFTTDSECVIGIGETSASVYVTCMTVGADGNLASNTLTIIDDENIDNSVTVTNPEPLTGGADYEDDDAYRERLLTKNESAGFGSLPYYEDLGNNISGVHDILLIDTTDTTGSGKPYTKKILVNGDNKPTPDDIIVDVLTEFTKSENIVLDHIFTIGKPSYTSVDLTVNLSVEVEIDTGLVNELLTCFFNGGTTESGIVCEGLSINEDLTRNALYGVFDMIDRSVLSTEILVSGSEITTVSPATNGVLKLGTVTVNQTEVES